MAGNEKGRDDRSPSDNQSSTNAAGRGLPGEVQGRGSPDRCSTATIRSFRSLSFVPPCSPSMTPMGRQVSAHPGKAGSSMSTNTSTGSPSSAAVEGTNPKSLRKGHPRWQHFFQLEDVFLRVKSKLLRLPFGVSMTTRSICLSPESNGLSRVGFAKPLRTLFFLLISHLP